MIWPGIKTVRNGGKQATNSLSCSLITWRLTGVPIKIYETPMRTTLMITKSATAEEFIKTTTKR
jgi:phage host-nuclease inhibitor protein Gam